MNQDANINTLFSYRLLSDFPDLTHAFTSWTPHILHNAVWTIRLITIPDTGGNTYHDEKQQFLNLQKIQVFWDMMLCLLQPHIGCRQQAVLKIGNYLPFKWSHILKDLNHQHSCEALKSCILHVIQPLSMKRINYCRTHYRNGGL